MITLNVRFILTPKRFIAFRKIIILCLHDSAVISRSYRRVANVLNISGKDLGNAMANVLEAILSSGFGGRCEIQKFHALISWN